MGIGAWWHWLVVLVIVILVFGTKKLGNVGKDVGSAVKNFKDAMKEEGAPGQISQSDNTNTVEGEIKERSKQ